MAEPLRILFLGHYFPPEMGGGATRFHWLTRELAALGHRVTVITGMPNYPGGVILPEYRGKVRLWEELDGVEVLRTWVYPATYHSRWQRLANYLSFTLSSILAGLSIGRRFDVIIAASPPPFVGLSGWALARLHGIPWLLDIGDLWPEVAIEAGELSDSSLLTRLGYMLARFLYRRAGHLTPVTESKRQRLIGGGFPADKITVIENGICPDDPMLYNQEFTREGLGLQGRFVVVYAGLIGIAQGIEIVIEAAQILCEQPDCHFLIVGDGVRRESIVKRAHEMQLPNITFLPAQPREAIPGILSMADVVWVPLVSERLSDAVPSKLLEAWGNRKAVILSAGGEAARLVEESGGGVVIPPGQPEQLAGAILTLKQDRDSLQAYGESGYRFVAQKHNCRLLARRMEEVVLEMMSRKVQGRGAKA